jgi:hypothetical protein
MKSTVGEGDDSSIGQNNYRNRVLKPAAKNAVISGLDLLTLRRTVALEAEILKKAKSRPR